MAVLFVDGVMNCIAGASAGCLRRVPIGRGLSHMAGAALAPLQRPTRISLADEQSRSP
jgi:hypothetical protein